jgi:hypothetical protein
VVWFLVSDVDEMSIMICWVWLVHLWDILMALGLLYELEMKLRRKYPHY